MHPLSILDEPSPATAETACIPGDCVCAPPRQEVDGVIEIEDISIDRRQLMRTLLAGGAGAALLAACGEDDSDRASDSSGMAGAPKELVKMEIGFCSQVLCGLPLEVAIKQGYFKEQGYDITLVYMRGGSVAMNALLSNALEWIATPMDVVISAWGSGKQAVMVASLASLPFFALVSAPGKNINTIADLRGKKIGINNLNTTDHLLGRYLLTRAGVPENAAEFLPIGANQFDAVARGQVDAGMVQEPALTLIERQGGKVLVNLMKQSDAVAALGGPYQFMGLNTRPEVLQANPDLPKKLVAALARANEYIRTHAGADIVKNIPEEYVAGGDDEVFAKSLDQVKNDLYPASPRLDPASIQRVVEVQKLSGVLQNEIRLDSLYTNQYVS